MCGLNNGGVIMNKQVILDEFNNCIDDKERWQWVIDNHQDACVTIYLDNDLTFGHIEDDDDGEYILYFDDYLGWSDGVCTLLDVFNIKAECV